MSQAGARPGLNTYAQFELLMRERYTVERLVNVSRVEFEGTLRRYLELNDPAMEGYVDAAAQRDFSVRFRWGHNHDFGTFALAGEMQNRHLWLLSSFVDEFDALKLPLRGAHVLDIGAWTGGTSLLLHALGAHVVAVEEVQKYAQALAFLAHAFGLTGFTVIPLSLYECTGPEFQDAFDYVLFAGVLYHLTDPILGLRYLFNALRDGGTCLLETYALEVAGPLLKYEGAASYGGGTLAARNRSGWNWFRPSPEALQAMLTDVGYRSVRMAPLTPDGRLLAVANRDRHRDMLRAGLSVPTVR